MRISGKYQLAASSQKIWQMLNDPQVLARITPGIQSLEEVAPDHYKAISEVKIGPVKGRFSGDLRITDKNPEKSSVVELNQQSKIGNAKARITMELHIIDDAHTEIQYSGEAQVSGMLARMGQRLISGVVSTLAKQFFEALAGEINQET